MKVQNCLLQTWTGKQFKWSKDILAINPKIAAIKLNKATGHDKIPAKVLKITAKNISQSLAEIVNSSLKYGYVSRQMENSENFIDI